MVNPIREQPGRRSGGQHGGVGADFVLHPLIHTFPSGNSAQNLVACSQTEKWGLKYVIYTSRENGGIFCISTINF